MRRLFLASPACLVALAAALSSAPAASAQSPPRVRLQLLDQTPVATAEDPVRLRIRAVNVGAAGLAEVTATLSIYYPAGSRSAYRRSLEGEPAVSQILVAPFPERGPLARGEERIMSLERRLPELEARGESALYPVKVQLDADGVAVATIRMALTFIHERPLVPLDVAVTVALDEAVLFRPDGALLDEQLPRSIAPDGRIEGIIAALEAVPVQATLVVSPLLVEQLNRMSRGYTVVAARGVRTVAPEDQGALSAAALLERIRSLARDPRIEVVALPLASPSVPALVGAGLTTDLASHMARGRDLLEHLLPGASLTDGMFLPPGGALTARSIRALSRLGVRTLLADAAAFPPDEGASPTGPPAVDVPAGRGRFMRAVAPDPGVDGLLKLRRAEPFLRAQRAIGELSAIYFEQPGTGRGAAVLFGSDGPADAGTLRSFLGQLHAASPEGQAQMGWLRPVKASRIAEVPQPPRRSLARSEPFPLSPPLVNGLRRARRAIEQLEAVTRPEPPLVEQLKRLLLVSESRHFTAAEHRSLALLAAVRDRVDREFEKVYLPSGSSVTLTSRRGLIPITMGSRADYPIRVRVRLVSPGLRFLDEAPRRLVLDRPRQAFTFPVLAQTTGRFPVRILLETPLGSPIAESRIVVRSTAYNTKALLVVGAAIAFLLALWGRRLLSWRR